MIRDTCPGPRTSPAARRRLAGSSPGSRHEMILDQVQRHGAVRVADLAAQLGVSDMTVRRDLDALDEAGPGGEGARRRDAADRDRRRTGLCRQVAAQHDEKQAIAAAAAGLVRAGNGDRGHGRDHDVAARLPLTDIADLIVVTNSVRVAETLLPVDRTRPYRDPDRWDPDPSDALVGPVAVQALRTCTSTRSSWACTG